MEKKEKKFLAGIVLLLFLLAIIVGFLLINKNNSSVSISDLLAESLAEADSSPNSTNSFTTSSHETILADQIKQDLTNISEYLTQLDETVIHNKEEILNLTTGQADEFEQLNSYLQNLQKSIYSLQSRFAAYENSYNTEMNITSTEFGNIKVQIDSVRENLEKIQNDIAESIHNTDISNAERYESLNSTIHNSASSLREKLDSVNKDITQILNRLQETNNEQNELLIAELQKSHEEIQLILDSMDIEIADAFEQISRHLDVTEAKLTDELQRQTVNSETKIIQNIDSGINHLLTNLDNVHSDISSTQDEIKDILSAIDTAETSRMTEIITRFTDINNKLTEINSAMESTHSEIKILINSLQETVQTTGENNKQELLNALTTINDSFSSQTTENFTQLVNSLKTQTEDIQNWFYSLDESMTKNFEDISNTVSAFEQNTSTNIEELINSFNQSFTKLSAAVDSINQATSDNKDAILNRISELEINTASGLEKVETELQSVFQHASDGKKLLASALLAKHVSAKEDATFHELYEAILSIDQQIVIGVEQVPGSISFDYHYHTGDPENGSGCYTKKLYHQHGPECYSKATCTVTVHTNGGFFSEGDDWCPCHGNVHRIKQNVIRRHSSCGAADNYGQISFTEHHGPGTDGFKGYDSSTHSYDKLSCGKTNATFVGWDVGCGMVDGQIIAAHIIYDHSTVPTALTSGQTKPENYIPKIYDDYVTTESTSHSSQHKPEEETSVETETDYEKESLPETEETIRPETEAPEETENTAETGSLMETESSDETKTGTGQHPSSAPATEGARAEETFSSGTDIESE